MKALETSREFQMKRWLALLFVLLAAAAPQARGYAPAETSCFLHPKDGLGSTRLLTTTNGAVANVFAYDAYGTLIASNAAPQTDYLFTGEQRDPNLGFYYLRARYLNTGTGRFWTRDTHPGNNQDPLSLHRYLYCHADPVNRVDPSGHETLVQLNASMLISSYIQGGVANVTANAVMHAVLRKKYSGREIAWDFVTGGFMGASGIVTKFLASNLGTTWVAKLAIQGGRHGINALIGTAESYLKNESCVSGDRPIKFDMEQFAIVFMINYAASVAGDFAEVWAAPIIERQKAALVNAVMRLQIRTLTDLRNWLDSMATTSASSVSASERVFYGSLRSVVKKAIPRVQNQAGNAEKVAETMLEVMQETILETSATAVEEWASP